MTAPKYYCIPVKARFGWAVFTHWGVPGEYSKFITWHWAWTRSKAMDRAVRYATKRHLVFEAAGWAGDGTAKPA